MSQYVFQKSVYMRKVTVIGIFCLVVALYSCVMLLMGQPLFWILLLISLYQAFNTFVSLSNPSEVTLTEDTLAFSAYGKTHSYKLADIKSFRVKELDRYHKMYVRVNDGGLLRGRYWLNCREMEGGRELWDRLAYLEYEKEPDQIKFRAYRPKNPSAAQEEPEQSALEEKSC